MTVLAISGPTCAGKTVVEKALHSLGYAKMISHTTREPRAGEVHGVDYHFVSEAEFSDLKETRRFIETIGFGAARYGKSVTSLVEAVESAKCIATVLEPVGARALRTFCKSMRVPFIGVWLDCPPLVQAERFLDRIADDPLAGAQRLADMLSIEQDWRDDRLGLYDLDLSTHTLSAERIAERIAEFVKAH